MREILDLAGQGSAIPLGQRDAEFNLSHWREMRSERDRCVTFLHDRVAIGKLRLVGFGDRRTDGAFPVHVLRKVVAV